MRSGVKLSLMKKLLLYVFLVLISYVFSSYSLADTNDKFELFYFEDFSNKKFSYVLPHKHNTSVKAKKIENGYLKVTLKPKMYGASSDKKNNKERAEYGKKIFFSKKFKIDKKFIMSFDARVDKNFKADKRTMIAQIRAENKMPGSPAAAVYLYDGGVMKCVNFRGKDKPSTYFTQNHTKIKSVTNNRVDVLDGEWHKFEIIMKLGEKNGYCKVSVDNEIIFEINDYDNIHGTKKMLARIGIYRDALPYEQTVYFDNLYIGIEN